MKVVIAGGGRFGRTLAEILVKNNVKIYVIDINEEICNKLGKEIPAVVVLGDASDPKILNEIGMGDTDFFIAMTGDDEMNIICSLLAKELGAKRVIARIEDPRHIDMCRELEIEYVYPAEIVAKDLAKLMTSSA